MIAAPQTRSIVRFSLCVGVSMLWRSLVGALSMLAVIAPAHAGVTYSESVDGDLSGVRSQPTMLALAAGSNLISGSVGNAAFIDGDLDYVAVIVPARHRLTSMIQVSESSQGPRSFVAMEAGPVFSVAPDDAPLLVHRFLGWSHFGPGVAGTDLLPELASAPGAQGFTAPLASGTYTFWLQELGPATPYAFDFRVSPVPELQTSVLMSLALATVLAIARVRGRSRSRGS